MEQENLFWDESLISLQKTNAENQEFNYQEAIEPGGRPIQFEELLNLFQNKPYVDTIDYYPFTSKLLNQAQNELENNKDRLISVRDKKR